MAPPKVDVVTANQTYANNFGERGNLPKPPTKKLAVVTCMDSRLNPIDFLGLQEGDAHIFRNAGGLVKESIRSLAISQRLAGTEDILVVHHTDCGMLTFTDGAIREQLAKDHPGDAAVADAANSINFGFFSDLDESVKSDVQSLKSHPLIQQNGEITGWVYDVENGKIRRVV